MATVLVADEDGDGPTRAPGELTLLPLELELVVETTHAINWVSLTGARKLTHRYGDGGLTASSNLR